jgi:glycosyltransferase involved in cell wall biosynthesis
MTGFSSRPAILFAMRYPDDVGMVWNSIVRSYDAAAKRLSPRFDCLVAFPRLTGNPKFAPRWLTSIEADFYTRPDGDRLANVVRNYRVKTIVYMGCDPATIDLPQLRASGVRTINYERDSYPVATGQPFWKRTAKQLLRRRLRWNLHDLYIANAHHQRDFLLNFACLPPERVTTIVNGVDVDYFTPGTPPDAAELGVPDTNHYVLSICQARPEKRVDFLIDAAAEVFRRAPDLSLTFVHVGDGECLQDWKAKAESLGLQNRFRFIGFRNDVLPFLRLATCLVHTAERESFGLVVAEAMACGKPVISTNAPGPAEIVLDGWTGRLMKQPDAAEFADAILKLLTEGRLEAWGNAARERAIERFDLKRQVNELADLIDKTTTLDI